MQDRWGKRFTPASLLTFQEWRKLVQDSQTASDIARLRRINDFFNRRIRFEDDVVVWGQSDYWATPMETFDKGAGDCEDFATAKYFTLLSAGVPDDKLRLIYVQARIGGASSAIRQAHMVLAFYPSIDAEPLVLDNLINDIQPASRRSDLIPVFSFNSKGLWQGASGPRGTGNGSNLTRWQDLLTRARAEGFQLNPPAAPEKSQEK